MPRTQTLARFIRNLSFRKNSNSIKTKNSNRPVAPMMIAAVALLAAVAFSVSVESRSGFVRKAQQPSTPAANPEVAKNSTPSSGAAKSNHSAASPNFVAPFTPTVTASKNDSLIVDNDVDLKADPGDTLRYTVTIGAAGENATGVNFTDTVDPNTTFVAGTLSASPIAVNDTFPVTVTGNVSINSANLAAPFSVVSNDFMGVNPTSTISAFDANTTNGGQIVMTTSGADIGKFTYNPPPGFEGVDTFTYTLSDNANVTSAASNRTATVSITVSGMFWFINNNPGIVCPCDGRLTNPFNTLAAFAAINDGVDAGLSHHPAANDNIFLYESPNDYNGPVTLLGGQKFIGQDATQTLAAISGITPVQGSNPAFPNSTNPTGAIVNIATNGITVNSNNTSNRLQGFTGGNATTDISGTNFGTLNVSDVTLNGTGRALNLSSGTLNGTFGSISSATSGTTGISLTTVGGSLTTGSTTISGSTGIGINVNTSSLALSFAATSVTTSGGTGISLTTNTGAITFGALTITPNANQRGLLATDNTQTITIPSGTITTNGAAAVEITRASSTTPLSVVLNTVSTTGGPNGIFLRNTSGSFTVNGTTANTSVGGDGTGGTISGMTGVDGTTNGIGVYADNVQNLTLRRVTINGTNQGWGIRGYSVNNFTLEYATVNGTNGTSAALAPPEGAGEGAVYFGNTTTTGMTGTGVITNCIISGGRSRNFSLINSSGTLNRLTVTGTTFGLVQNFIDAQRVFSVEGRPSAIAGGGTILNTTVTGSSFAGSPGDVVNFTGQEPSTTTSVAMDVIFQNNAVTNTHGFNTIGGFGLKLANFQGMTFNVSGNSFRDANGSTIVLQMGTPVAGSTIATNLSGTINNNTIGVVGVADSGSKTGNGIFLSLGDNTTAPKGVATFAITNNTIRNWHGNFGISADNTGGNYNLNTTITGNTVLNPAATSFSGLGMAAGAPSSADDIDVCAAITGNDFSASSPAGVNIDVLIGVSGSASSIRLPNYVGTTLANVQTFVQNNQLNAASTTVSAFDDNGNGTTAPSFSGGATPCTLPTTGPVTADSLKTESGLSSESVNNQLRTALEESATTLYASKGAIPESPNVMKLTQSAASAMVQAAISRWAEAGMSAANLARLQSLSVEIADLPGSQLATVSSSKITLDQTAAGYGWYFDPDPSTDDEFEVPVENKELQTTETSDANGHFDLLTVLMRQLGSQSLRRSAFTGAAPSWLMEGTLDTGTRRAPAFKPRTVGKAKSAPAATVAKQVRATTGTENQQVAASNGPRISRVLRNHAMRAAAPNPFAVDVSLAIGTIPAGKSTTIIFNVTVNNPWQGATNQVSNQGTVSGSNFANVLTDDPAVGGAADPTLTTIDQPDVTVAVAPLSVDEDGGTNLVYTFTREGLTTNALTVNFSVGGSATFNTDYTQTGAATFNASSGTVSIPAGSSTATVTLDPTGDITVEGNETAILTVVSGTSYDVGAPAAATGTITNDDTDVTVAVAPLSVEEDGVPNLVYTFTRNGVTTGALTVNFSVGGTATFNTDYTQTGAATFNSTDGTVTFAAGSSTAAVTVDPTADNTVESAETVVLTVTAGTGYNVANPSTATGTINNDDAEVTLAVAPSSVDEDGVPNLVYTFTRTGDTTGALTVNFSVGGTATFNTDYTQTGATTFTAIDGSVTIADGNSTAAITVDPSADSTSEPDETVILTLTTGTGYNIGTPSTATGTINNDDTTVSVAVSPLSTAEDGVGNLEYTFTRSDSSGPLTVNFSVGGSATFNTDYTQTGAATFNASSGTVTFADGSLTAIVTVDPSTDSTVEPDETVILTVTAGAGYVVGAPASATGTITNDDTDVSVAVAPLSTAEDGVGNLVYTFTRTGVTTGALTVNFSVGGSATFNTDYTQTGATTFNASTGTVDFAAGSSTAVVTVDPSADNSVEPDETVVLTVTAGTGYNVGAPSVATGTITNDDSSVSVAVAPLVVDEDGVPNLVYTFTRTGSTTGALTVNFSVGGSATFNTDYTQTGAATFNSTDGTVTFAAGSATAAVTVDPSADGTTEPDETVILTVTAGTGYEVGAPDSATGTINNDDNAVSVAVSPLSTAEDGVGNLEYTFTRGDSSGALTVNFSVGGSATFNTDYTQTGAATFNASSGTVTFADGSLTATVTVDPSADSSVEPDETVILTVTAGAGYTVGAPASATGTITNDDTDVSVAVAPLSTAEDGVGNLVYTFTRNGVTTGPLTVNFSVGGTATFNTDYTQTGAATFNASTGTVTFLAGNSTATVTVDPTADGAAELDETVILTVTAGTGYNVAAPSVATGTITNDDTEVSVAVSPSSVLEDGATNMVYTFTRVGLTSGPLTVNFSVGGTAAFAPPGGDYFASGATTFTATSGTIDFLAGSSTATITVDPLGDADQEPNETVILTVTAGAGYTVGTPSSATGTITNDDNSPPTVVVGYGQCNGDVIGTVNLLVADVETPAGSLVLSATSSNTAVVPLANITFGGSGANRTLRVKAVSQASVAFSDLTVTVSDGSLTSSINVRVIVGTNKTEVINIGTTTVGTDMIFGGNGDDTINSGGGNDLICGGNGGGTINAGLGEDTIDGGNGNDNLIGGDGNDHIFGGGGNDTLNGGIGDDLLDGGTGNDTMTGGAGADNFIGGSGTDTATDFNVGQGDTKDGSVEIASLLFGTNSGGGGVLAYLAPPPRYWVSPWGTVYF